MKYILIIGANSDVGYELAKVYALKGFNLFLLSRKIERLENLALELSNKYKIKVKVIQIDITKKVDQNYLLEEINITPYGIISAVGKLKNNNEINNNDDVEDLVSTNFLSIVKFINIFLKDLKKRKSGFIVGISSVAGDRGRKKNYIYGSAKSAFSEYLSGLRSELHPYGIHVMNVKPGFIKSKMTAAVKLPKILTSSPSKVAKIIYECQNSKRNIVYISWIWRYIMILIKLIPENIFKKINL